MTLGRLGEPGSEIPVIRHDGRIYDLRSLTADIDGAFLSSDGIARARAAAAAGELPELDGAARPARRAAGRPPGQDRLHRPELPRPRGRDRAPPFPPSRSCS